MKKKILWIAENKFDSCKKFAKYLRWKKLPNEIWFDTEKEYVKDCVDYLINYCDKRNLDIPNYYISSSVVYMDIARKLENYKKAYLLKNGFSKTDIEE